MSRLRSRRGVSIVDVVVTIFLLGTCGVIFSSTFPPGFSASQQAKNYKVATAIAQRKMEQLRAMNYESLTYNLLASVDIIDTTDMVSPYSFTDRDNVSAQLPGGVGTLHIEDIPGTELKRVTVTITWEGVANSTRTVQLTTLFADKRTRAGS